MEIPPHEIRVRSRFGPLKVRVTADTITALRETGSRSLPAFVIAERRALIDAIAIAKFEAGNLDGEGFVLIDTADLPDEAVVPDR